MNTSNQLVPKIVGGELNILIVVGLTNSIILDKQKCLTMAANGCHLYAAVKVQEKLYRLTGL